MFPPFFREFVIFSKREMFGQLWGKNPTWLATKSL